MGRVKMLKPFAVRFAALIAVFFLSMALVYCIPASWIEKNVAASVEIMEGEGDYPMYFFYRHSSIMDVHTDKLMYESLIQNRDYYNPIQASVSVNQYPRYWHGYQVVLRPLTVFFQVQEVRYLGMLAFHLLLFWSAWLLAKRTRPANAVLYVLTIATGNIALSAVCLQFMNTFLILFATMAVLLSRYEKFKERAYGFSLFFFTVGMVENFFDFLTYPIITLGIPLVALLWIKAREEQADLRENLLFTVKSSVAWGLGYALTWIAKWGIATVVLGVRYFWRTMSVVQYRLEGSAEEPLDRIGTIRKNLKAWLNVQDDGLISWSKVALVVLVIALVLILVRKVRDLRAAAACLPMLLVALYPYVWYLVMSNHSQIHYWYTYRAQLVALFGGLMFLGSILRERKRTPSA
ncbi:MAG: hypothetical protein Q4C82_03055 [Eubacteriales bacterium]|nr:hypothetical protein [Eubacteriales bacterium]